jgi:hypothetical protein
MQYIQGKSRHQTYFTRSEDQVSTDNAVRLIDAFIDKLDLAKLVFNKAIPKTEGNTSQL